ncbi:MAG: hypothetical protein KBA30_08630 [Clostridia bacterium]|nr:hypothetical protein [Clostridia bacterium]
MKASGLFHSTILHRTVRTAATVFLLCALLMGMPGCGGDGTPIPTTSPTTAPTTIGTSTSASSTALTPSATTVLPRPGGALPLVEKPAILRVVIADSPRILTYGYGENAFTTWLQDRTGVQVEFILFPEMKESSKLSFNPYVGGDLGDLVLYSWSRSAAERAGESGVMQPLESLVEVYAPHIRAALAALPFGQAVSPTDEVGRRYSLPALPDLDVQDPDAFGMRMWIHQGFLDAYGGGMPATTDELAAFLAWVRDADANGNGDADDEIGWTGAESTSVSYARPTDFLMNAFTYQDGSGYYVGDGFIHCAFIEDGYRDGLRYLCGLMGDGLMDPDYAGHTAETLRAVVGRNGGDTVACISAARRTDFSDDPAVCEKYVTVPPLAGPDGFTYAFYDPFTTLRSSSRDSAAGRVAESNYLDIGGTVVAAIPADSQCPELAMAWLDALYDPEVLQRARFGEQDTDWTLPAAGTTAIDGGPARIAILRDVWAGPTAQHWGTSFPLTGRTGSGMGLAAPGETTREAAVEYAAVHLYEPFAVPCAIPPLSMDPDTTSRVVEERRNIGDYSRAMVTDFISGSLDIDDDAAWAEYRDTIRALGLDDCLTAMQTTFDRDWRDVYPKPYTAMPLRER